MCGVWGWPMVLIVRCTSAWEMQLWGQGWGGLQRLWPPAGDAVVLPEIGAVWSDLGGDTGSSGSGAKHPTPQSASPPQKSPKRISQNPAFTLPASEMLLVLFFYLRLLCPRLRIRKTMEKPTPKQTHEGLFTSSSLCPSTPDIAEQGLGPQHGF